MILKGTVPNANHRKYGRMEGLLTTMNKALFRPRLGGGWEWYRRGLALELQDQIMISTKHISKKIKDIILIFFSGTSLPNLFLLRDCRNLP